MYDEFFVKVTKISGGKLRGERKENMRKIYFMTVKSHQYLDIINSLNTKHNDDFKSI